MLRANLELFFEKRKNALPWIRDFYHNFAGLKPCFPLTLLNGLNGERYEQFLYVLHFTFILFGMVNMSLLNQRDTKNIVVIHLFVGPSVKSAKTQETDMSFLSKDS